MKKIFFVLTFMLSLVFLTQSDIHAATGDMGFFGGIIEGVKLPKTTEQMIAATSNRNTVRNLTNMQYKEVVFLSGEAVELTGLLSVRQQGDVVDTADVGTYRITYTVGRSAASDENNWVTRTITFNVNWRRAGNQVIKDMEVSSWTERITIGGVTYDLDSAQSHFSVSILEDNTPGVTYSKGDLSVHAYYASENAGTVLDLYGSLYGYTSAWSNTEAQRLNGQVYTDDWQISYQVRPSVSVFKTLEYSKNEPAVISFDGNYLEKIQSEAGLTYDIFNTPQHFIEIPLAGNSSINVPNTFEQLPAYDLSAIQTHFAVTDIHKLFSMGVITGETYQYDPSQLITRGQFVTMLVRAIKLPIEQVSTTTSRTTRNRTQEITFTFPDVLSTNAIYPYVMAAYRAGIAGGRGDGQFYADYPIQREEALVMIMRTIGLSNLGLEPTSLTPFTDDEDISSWAKKDLYAAARVGIIQGDLRGNITPTINVTKAEAAALINALIDYMRVGMRVDYADYIVNYTD